MRGYTSWISFGTSELETFGLGTILRMREVYNVDGFGPTSSQLERIPCPLYRLYLPNRLVDDLVWGSLATIRTYESATRPSLWLYASDNALQERSLSGRDVHPRRLLDSSTLEAGRAIGIKSLRMDEPAEHDGRLRETGHSEKTTPQVAENNNLN